MEKTVFWFLLFIASGGVVGFCPVQLQRHQQPVTKQTARFLANCWRPAFRASSDDNNNSNNNNYYNSEKRERRRRLGRKWLRRIRRTLGSAALGLSLRSAQPAIAEDIVVPSIRPGATAQEADSSVRGEGRPFDELLLESQGYVEKIDDSADNNDAFGQDDNDMMSDSKQQKKKKGKQKKRKKKDDLYGDLEDYDDLMDLSDFMLEETQAPKTTKSSRMPTQSSSSSYYKSSASAKMYQVTGVAVVGIPFVLVTIREYFRRRNEAAYMAKALKIAENQRAEYLRSKQNATAAESNNSTAVDEEDAAEDEEDHEAEDDVEGDEEEEEEDDSDDDDDEEGDGDEGPTQDDIDRLNRLMGR